MKRVSTKAPPRWAVALMTVTTARGDREHVLGDLEEEFRRLTKESSGKVARAWYRRQVLRSVLPNLSARRAEKRRLTTVQTGPLGSSRRAKATLLSLPDLSRDFRLAARTMARKPLSSLLMILTLALGLGASMTIWSVVQGVLLKPLPYQGAEHLTTVWTVRVDQESQRGKLTGPELAALWERSQLYEGFGSIWTRFGSLSDGDGGPEQIHIGFVTGNFFEVLGARPLLGRGFLPEEDLQNGPNVILLSHGIWQRRYAADPDIVGQSVEFNGEPFTVVGVMPAGFRIWMPPDAGLSENFGAWLPWQDDYAAMDRDWRLWSTVGRLQAGTSIEAGRAELRALAQQLRSEHPQDERAGLDFVVEPLQADVVARIRPGVLAAFGAVGLLLLIALTNVANLILLQAGGRGREMALRAALGAGRARILRQLLSENLLLFFLGGMLGILVAQIGIELLFFIEPPDLPRLADVRLDATTFGFAFVVMLVSGLLLGSLPVLKGQYTLAPGLGQGARTTDGSPRRARGFLVMSEVATAAVLLVGAGLMLRSFDKLSNVDTGFEAKDVLSLQLSLPFTQFSYADPSPISTFYEDLVQGIESIAGVELAAVTEGLPLTGFAGNPEPYSYRSEDGVIEWGTLVADYRAVGTDYFETLGITKLSGRYFEATDDLSHPTVAIIDQTLAEATWPGENPVGKEIQAGVFLEGETNPVWAEVVGVVEHVRNLGLEVTGREQIYLHHEQSPRRSMTVVVRSKLGAEALVPQIKEQLRAIDPARPIFNVRWLEELLASASAETRFLLNLLAAFALFAMVLAGVGIYGVLAQLVLQSTKEFGVRRACGALGRQIVGRVIYLGMALSGCGLVVGLLMALVLGRVFENLVFGITVRDPVTFLGVASLVVALALAACVIPAVRASRVDPIQALRAE